MKSNKAFTLVELMIVISIVGMLAAIATPKFSDMVRKAHEAVTKNNLGVLRSVTSIYYADHTGVWPYEGTDVASDVSGDATFSYLSDLDGGLALVPKYVSEIPALQTGQLIPIEGKNEVAVAVDGGAFDYDTKSDFGTTAAWVYMKDLGTWYINSGDEKDTKGEYIHSW
ncbi:prepilin-type N-terminal cleavage/methylation domain-containing protein [bacterium]|nr:prepilin-type N-terminal cleavage/methylation domain-containing protein [bacterium]MBU3954960.1 prepilin-type N-terminal cleavage/methylation domain-containing protein [bacterium]MBU4133980.1 prepilin-type N-terminal cleavage/methylation domain-containing protein [bacterium]